MLLVVSPSVTSAFPGIDFASMPIGCHWTLEYTDGTRWTSVFTGEEADTYIVKTFETANMSKLIVSSRYNKVGLLTERVYSNGGWEHFKPYNCYTVLEDCQFTFENSDGLHSKRYSKTTKHGKNYTVEMGEIDGKRFIDEKFRLGPFDMEIWAGTSSNSISVTSFSNCKVLVS